MPIHFLFWFSQIYGRRIELLWLKFMVIRVRFQERFWAYAYYRMDLESFSYDYRCYNGRKVLLFYYKSLANTSLNLINIKPKLNLRFLMRWCVMSAKMATKNIQASKVYEQKILPELESKVLSFFFPICNFPESFFIMLKAFGVALKNVNFC